MGLEGGMKMEGARVSDIKHKDGYIGFFRGKIMKKKVEKNNKKIKKIAKNERKKLNNCPAVSRNEQIFPIISFNIKNKS
jgi:hypothetical protein